MARRVFFSFHYELDNWRASQIRNIGVIEGNRPATDNEWEKIKSNGDKAIKRWINEQLCGKSCTIVLIGKKTAERKWIKYEIEKSWNDGKGVLGIYIHNLKDSNGKKTNKGKNPFDNCILNNGTKLSEIVKAYDPPFFNSKLVYDYIRQNISRWIDEAISIRLNVKSMVKCQDLI